VSPTVGVLVEGLTTAAGEPTTVIVWLLLRLAPLLSVTVNCTTTVPAALVARLALLPSVAPTKLAKLDPLVMAQR
jgi:hypothetical protein